MNFRTMLLIKTTFHDDQRDNVDEQANAVSNIGQFVSFV